MGVKLWLAEKAALPGVSHALTVIKAVVSILGGVRAAVWFGFLLFFLWSSHHWQDKAHDLQTERDNAQHAAELADAKAKAAEANVSVKVVTHYVDRVQVVRGRTQTIVKEVPIYVPADAPALPPGFRVLHDAAAQGVLPDPARIADAAPVAAQDAAETVTDNYGTCHQNAEQLTALQEWIREQHKLK